MAFSLKKLQQRSRRQAAARRPPSTTAHASILRKADHRRNNSRKVVFSATHTAKFFHKTNPSLDVSTNLVEKKEETMLPHKPEPVEEEDSVRFGNDTGREEPVEPIARRTRKKKASGREVASLRSDLGPYWSLVTAPRVRRAPSRFVP